MECTVNRAASLYAATNNYVTLITYMHFLLIDDAINVILVQLAREIIS